MCKIGSLLLKSVILTSLVSIASCATIFNSGAQSLTVLSSDNQEGIAVEVYLPSGFYRTKLPTVIAAPAAYEGVTIKVIDDCYDYTEQIIQTKITPSFYANILASVVGILFVAIDAVSGNMWRYSPITVITVNKKDECEDD